jgi:hypothetical protein
MINQAAKSKRQQNREQKVPTANIAHNKMAEGAHFAETKTRGNS